MTVAYETVWIDRGGTEAGADGEPNGFGDLAHYDVTPSPITLLGGGSVSLGAVLSGAADLFEYGATGKGFSNPIAAVIAGVNLAQNIGDLTQAGINEDITNIITSGSDSVYDNVVSGLPNANF